MLYIVITLTSCGCIMVDGKNNSCNSFNEKPSSSTPNNIIYNTSRLILYYGDNLETYEVLILLIINLIFQFLNFL
jgi:hypothetical protein